VSLDIGVEGLVHISELSDPPPQRPEDVVRQGDELVLRILDIDSYRRRIGLSLKQVPDEVREAWLAEQAAEEEEAEQADGLAEEPVKAQRETEDPAEQENPEPVAEQAAEPEDAAQPTDQPRSEQETEEPVEQESPDPVAEQTVEPQDVTLAAEQPRSEQEQAEAALPVEEQDRLEEGDTATEETADGPAQDAEEGALEPAVA
jgi:predicted RNA-binding protein with RPS1 domain